MSDKQEKSHIEYVATDSPPVTETFCPECGERLKTRADPPYECLNCGEVF